MKTKPMPLPKKDHLVNAPQIIAALTRRRNSTAFRGDRPNVEYLSLPGLKNYQRALHSRFGDLIEKESHDYISKTGREWLLVGDRRQEIAEGIHVIIERYGLGVGILALHAQQVHTRHLVTRLSDRRRAMNLATPSSCLTGANGEVVLSIPLRRFRNDLEELAALNVIKPRAFWEPDRIVSHEPNGHPCFYCSCGEINPAEVVIHIEGARHGLSRDYSLGFTFAPFGNPLSVVHFLAWDRAREPLNMSRVPMTVSDLVKLTCEINRSIHAFFSTQGVFDYPVIDGLSNGWAGNTIYHQHFQFFQPEYRSPILRARSVSRPAIVRRDDIAVQRLSWPVPVYRLAATEALNAGLVGNDLAGIWRLIGGSRRVPKKASSPFGTPQAWETIHPHTQNLYVPGGEAGRTVIVVLRDRERLNFDPAEMRPVGSNRTRRLVAKDNIGVLEATGTLIVDKSEQFEAMRLWRPSDVSRQVSLMLQSISPDASKLDEFEEIIGDLFPR